MCNISRNAASGSETQAVPPAALAQIPKHPVCEEALALAQRELSAPIFNHSLRVFLYARAFAADDAKETNEVNPATGPFPESVLFVACILHDLGTGESFDSSSERFEVCGADAAAKLLRKHGFDEPHVQQAWLAIAVHACPGIAERILGVVRIVRLAVRVDFFSYPPPPGLIDLSKEDGEALIAELPRLEVEKTLGDAVVRQSMKIRAKAPGGSWPGDLHRAKEADPDWDGVNKGF